MALTEDAHSINSGHGDSLSVPRGGNAFNMAKQRHQIRNLNVFERMHSIFDLAARAWLFEKLPHNRQ
jgi:hypothetical protein